VRNLLRAVDVLPGSYVVGLVAIVASPKGQRLGDLAAGTIVVRLDRGAPLDLPIDEPVGGDETFRFNRAQIAALGPLERQLLRQTLRRVEGLDDPDVSSAAPERSTEVLRGRIGYEPVSLNSDCHSCAPSCTRSSSADVAGWRRRQRCGAVRDRLSAVLSRHRCRGYHMWAVAAGLRVSAARPIQRRCAGRCRDASRGRCRPRGRRGSRARC
jgi:hypothetical protein